MFSETLPTSEDVSYDDSGKCDKLEDNIDNHCLMDSDLQNSIFLEEKHTGPDKIQKYSIYAEPALEVEKENLVHHLVLTGYAADENSDITNESRPCDQISEQYTLKQSNEPDLLDSILDLQEAENQMKYLDEQKEPTQVEELTGGNVEMLHLVSLVNHKETLQESIVTPEETICEVLIENLVEQELPKYKEELKYTKQSRDSEEQPNLSVSLVNQTQSEEPSQSECPINIEPRDLSKQFESSCETKPTAEFSECSTGTESLQLLVLKNSEKIVQLDKLQRTEQDHIGCKQHKEENKSKSQTKVVSSENICVVEEMVDYIKNEVVDVAVDRGKARTLAARLYRLENFQRTDVVKHLDKE